MNEKTQPCTHCGAVHPRVNLTWMGSAELCPECLQRYTVCCDCCGERIWMANDYGTHYLHLCASCRADNYVTCENCGALIPQEDAHYNDEDEAYCDSCYERGYGGTIHNYSYKPEPIFYGDGPLYLGVELEVDEAGKDNINAVQALQAFNQENVYGYVKSDGSLNDGFELVTHPCTLETHLQQVPWRETLEPCAAWATAATHREPAGCMSMSAVRHWVKMCTSRKRQLPNCCTFSSASGRRFCASPGEQKARSTTGLRGTATKIAAKRF